MKRKRTATIKRDPEIPWFAILSFEYHPDLVEAVRNMQYPGAQYMPAAKAWLIPIEAVETFVQVLKEYSLEVKVDLSAALASPRGVPPSPRHAPR